MDIKVIKIPKNIEKIDIDLVFVDDENKEIAGHCIYNVLGDIGTIYGVYLYPNYRNKRIMSSHINNILCDMKCMGATTVKLYAISDELQTIWEKLGFRKVDGDGNMEIDVSNMECNCLCGVNNFIDELDIKELLEYVYKQ